MKNLKRGNLVPWSHAALFCSEMFVAQCSKGIASLTDLALLFPLRLSHRENTTSQLHICNSEATAETIIFLISQISQILNELEKVFQKPLNLRKDFHRVQVLYALLLVLYIYNTVIFISTALDQDGKAHCLSFPSFFGTLMMSRAFGFQIVHLHLHFHCLFSSSLSRNQIARFCQAGWSGLPTWLHPLTLSTSGTYFITLLVRGACGCVWWDAGYLDLSSIFSCDCMGSLSTPRVQN